ncbi:MAG TPA: GNAT family N-acetyltransferase [Bryobacteraceae bacterium]|nr:GNAT family N-acetyltransferase [Bryobacteraceae bacterium]
MAARLHPAPSRTEEIVDLRRLSARHLEPLLGEEIETWRAELEWDFEKSADLVRRFMDLRALNGSALIEGGEITGYVYYVLEDNKGLIGDLYVRRAVRTTERENRLLDSVLETIMLTPQIERIECQLLMIQPVAAHLLPRPQYLNVYERNFMRLDLKQAVLREGRPRLHAYLEKWSDSYQEATAQLIASAYTGHVDGQINDQYRSVAGARRFLYNIVQYPGCGVFYRPASYAAFTGNGTSRADLCGVSLASIVAANCGHITQICGSPETRGAGIGYQLLRQSLLKLREAECRSASLTVTACNREAVSLYERVGFETVRRFSACVWEGF